MSTRHHAEAAATPEVAESTPPPWHMAAHREANGSALRLGSAVREPWDYVPVPPFVVDDNGYLISDSMGQNNRHLGRMLAYGPALKARYRDRGFVGADLSMPYVKESPGKMVAPDLFVALAAQRNEERSSYKLWEEPAPEFVLEDLSPGNWRRDAVDKRVLYRRLGVAEYWMFDETGRHLRDDSGARIGELLVGYRLRDGEYHRVRANAAGRLPSAVLGLELSVRDRLVRFYDPATGEHLPTYDESQTQVLEERAGRLEERTRRLAANQRAEAEQARAAAALARVAALEAQLKRERSSD